MSAVAELAPRGHAFPPRRPSCRQPLTTSQYVVDSSPLVPRGPPGIDYLSMQGSADAPRVDLDAAPRRLGFGSAVRALRRRAGLSLNELARRAGVDPAYVH